jgi:uncharacterized lipoprotein
MKTTKLAIIWFFAVLSGCVSPVGPTLTPLEIQSLQTREYEHKKDVVFPSVISVFQDLGYTIKSADKATGFITAESAAKSDFASKFWLGVSNVSQTSATAFIEEIGKITKVRLNFVTSSKKSSAYGQTDRDDTPILDAETYINAFERVESAIFLRSPN